MCQNTASLVPIIRNADILSLSDIEKQIADFAKRAQDGKLGVEELTGGTYTISNGGASSEAERARSRGMEGMGKDWFVWVNGRMDAFVNIIYQFYTRAALPAGMGPNTC